MQGGIITISTSSTVVETFRGVGYTQKGEYTLTAASSVAETYGPIPQYTQKGVATVNASESITNVHTILFSGLGSASSLEEYGGLAFGDPNFVRLSSSSSSIVEISGNGYTHQTETFTEHTNNASLRQGDNDGDIEFPKATASWGTVYIWVEALEIPDGDIEVQCGSISVPANTRLKILAGSLDIRYVIP